MVVLEKLGLIEKTHLSSGRVPSLVGFHYYFDNILKPADISDDLRLKIRNVLEQTKSKQIDEIIKDSTKLLSEMTDYMSIYFSPEVTNSLIEDFRVIQLQNKNVMLIAGDNFGRVSERVISLFFIDDKIFNELARLIEINIIDKNLAEAKKYLDTLKGESEFRTIPEGIWAEINGVLDNLIKDHCYVDGAYNLFNYIKNESPAAIQDIISFINFKSQDFVSMMRSIGLAQTVPTKVQFVPQFCDLGTSDFVLISAQFDTRYLASGLLAVVGPQMMPYSKIVTVVNTFRDELQSQINAVEKMDEGV